MSKRCGDCMYWMNHDECPLEEYMEPEQEWNGPAKFCWSANKCPKYTERKTEGVE